MVAFNFRFYLLVVFITWKMTVSTAQFSGLPIGFGQNSFSSQNTNFNQNRRGFGLIAGFGGSSSTNFNQNSIQSSSSNGPLFRESQQQNTIDEIQARYASPYDLPQYSLKPHPNHGHNAVSYHTSVLPCRSNALVTCAPQVTFVSCSNPSYLSE